MIKLGEYNKLIVKRETNFGYFVGEEGANSNDDVLLHNRLLNKQKVAVGVIVLMSVKVVAVVAERLA